MNAVRQYGLTLALGLLLLLAIGPAKLFGAYAVYLINLTLIYAITTLTVSMLAGSAGIWSIGHTTFLAIGAYLAANMSTRGFTVEAIVLAALASSLLIGLVVGMSVGKFPVLYMALLTLALSQVAFEVIGRWRTVTGGDQGIAVGPARLLFLHRPLTSAETVMMTVVFATLVFLVVQMVVNSPRGKRWLAIKSQRMASQSIGMKPHVENALAFAFSGALASTAGICMAFTMKYLSPEAFDLAVAVMMKLSAVVSGVGSIGGALFGGMFLALVPELAREVEGVSAYVFGTATILVLVFLPEGVVPGISNWVRRRLSGAARQAGSGAHAPAGPAPAGDLAAGIRDLVGEIATGARDTLIVEGLSVSFGGLKALDEVSIQVAPGQVVGLIGPNGAGKTTLLNVLSGYVKPSQVRALRLGRADLARLPAHARTAHGFGRTFQHAELFHELPIRENILQAARMGALLRKGQRPQHDPEAITDRVLEALRLRPYAHAYPGQVPFGVQKVVDIARSVATGASMIVMDEPFSGLDATERDEVRAILHGLRRAGVSILIIDHVVHEVFDIADHVVVLDFGKVIAAGPPAVIRNDPKVLEAYLGSALSLQAEEVQAHV